MVVRISSPGLKSMPINRISSDSEALRVIAISSRSQPNSSARPVRIVSRLWLEDLPHGVSGGVFLFPDVTDERFGHDPRAGRNAAIVQIDDATRDAERVLNDGPVVFIHGRLFRRQVRHGLRRRFDVSQQRGDRRRRKRGQAEALACEGKKIAARAQLHRRSLKSFRRRHAIIVFAPENLRIEPLFSPTVSHAVIHNVMMGARNVRADFRAAAKPEQTLATYAERDWRCGSPLYTISVHLD